MTGVRDPQSGRHISDEELAWAADHTSELRRSVSEGRVRYHWLWASMAIGLVVHVAGFLLRSSTGAVPIDIVADLLYALGYALWTGVVVAVLVEVIPAAKERQIGRALDAYEALIQARGSGRVDADPRHDAHDRG